MSRLIIITGATPAIGRELAELLPGSVMFDGSWACYPRCETPQSLTQSVYLTSLIAESHLLTHDTVIITWDASETIIDDLLSRLEETNVHRFHLAPATGAAPGKDSSGTSHEMGAAEGDMTSATVLDVADRDPGEIAALIASQLGDTTVSGLPEGPATRSRFIPWPVPAGSRPYFPPGLFEVDCGSQVVPLWFDPAYSMDILPLAEVEMCEMGAQYAVTDEGDVFFYGTWFGGPLDDRHLKLARLNLTKQQWLRQPDLRVAPFATQELARLAMEHVGTTCPVISEGEIIIDHHVAHTYAQGNTFRIIHTDDDWDWDADEILRRHFTVLTIGATPAEGILIVTEGDMTYAVRGPGSIYTRADVPVPLRGMLTCLWSGRLAE